jgi:hypothetical protein
VGAISGGISASAYLNVDGSLVVPCLNTRTRAISASLSIKGFTATAVSA